MAFHQVYESVTEPSRALALFTDRKMETRHFLTYLNSKFTPENVLFFWGEGGNGKSLFLSYLRKDFCKMTFSDDDWNELISLNDEELVTIFKSMEEYEPVKLAFLDFGIDRENYRSKESFYALMQLRRDLSGCAISFPLFDFAVGLYLNKTNRLDKHKDLFPKEILDLGTEIAVVLLELTPRLKVAKSILNVLNKNYSKSAFLYKNESRAIKVDEEIVNKLNSIDAETELVNWLPKLFADDLNNSMGEANVPKRVVLFFDTYEAFWGTRERYFAEHRLFGRDEWLRELISLLDLDKGIIVVVAGREPPKWSTPNIRYCIAEENIDTQLIGHFKEIDAKDYLEKTGINDVSLQDSLIGLATVEKDEIHPFYLGLCVDIILQANLSGIKLTDQDTNQWLKKEACNKEQELIKRFLKYVETANLDYCIKAVSLCRSFDFELYYVLGEKLNLIVSEPSFKVLINFSFVKEFEITSNNRKEQVFRIHDLLRRVINEQNSEFMIRAQKVIENYYRKKAEEGDLTALGEAIYHKTQINWEEGADEWCEKFEEALNQFNFQLCSILQTLSFELKVEDISYLAKFAYYRGMYCTSISRYEEAFEELTFSILKYDTSLSQYPNNISVYYNKGLVLANLGNLQSRLSKNKEAKGSHMQAIEAYDKVLTETPDNIQAYNNKGISLANLGKLQSRSLKHKEAKESYTLAILEYDKTLSLAPNNMEAHKNKGLVQANLGKMQSRLWQHKEAKESYTLAIWEYDKALSLAPNNMEAHKNKGLALANQGKLQGRLSQHKEAEESYAQAIDEYDKVLSLSPDNIKANHNKGIALANLGNLQSGLWQHKEAKESYKQAIDEYDKVLLLASDNTYTHNNKGIVLAKLGELQSNLWQHNEAKESYKQAIDEYDKVLLLAPDNTFTHNNKGLAFAKLGKLQSSLSQNKEAKESYTQAIAEYDKVLLLAPNGIFTHKNKGLAWATLAKLQSVLGQHKEAEESYVQAIGVYDIVQLLVPDNMITHNNKGLALSDLGKLHSSLSQNMEAKESYKQAIDEYDKVLLLAPDNIITHNNKGLALANLGKLQCSISQNNEGKESYTQAIEVYDEVLLLAPDKMEAHNYKGNALARIGDMQASLSNKQEALESYTQAIKVYDKALSLAPDNIEVNNNKGNILERIGGVQASLSKQKETLESYNQAIKHYNKILRTIPNHSDAIIQKEKIIQKISDFGK